MNALLVAPTKRAVETMSMAMDTTNRESVLTVWLKTGLFTVCRSKKSATSFLIGMQKTTAANQSQKWSKMAASEMTSQYVSAPPHNLWKNEVKRVKSSK